MNLTTEVITICNLYIKWWADSDMQGKTVVLHVILQLVVLQLVVMWHWLLSAQP